MTRSIIATLEERFLDPSGTRYDTIGITHVELHQVIAEARPKEREVATEATGRAGALRDHPEFAAYKRANDDIAANLREQLTEAKDVVAETYQVFVREDPKDDDHEGRVEDRMMRLFGGDYPRRQKA